MKANPRPINLDAVIRRLIAKQQLDRIEITIAKKTHTRAFATPYHPVIKQRLTEAFATGEESITLADATARRRKCYESPIATSSGDTIAEAIQSLITELETANA